MFRKCVLLSVLVVLGLALAACQPVQPVTMNDQINAQFDFAVPDWGLQHGWVTMDVPLAADESEVATGSVRWVEVNDANEVRYVVAVPRCVSLSEDGQAALVAVEITDRWGWGEGDPGQWMQFWLNEAGNEFASPLWPPSDSTPGCAYEAPADTISLVAGRISIGQPAQPVVAAQAPAAGLHRIEGQFGFPSPEMWGVDLWIAQEFNVAEIDPHSHEATGSLNFGVYNVESREWKRIQSDVKYALFDDEAKAAMVISQITEKTGTGEGEPGEYACFWVRDGEPADQFGIHYYSDFHPEAGFKEYFPADEVPALAYAEPAETIEVESGDVAILR